MRRKRKLTDKEIARREAQRSASLQENDGYSVPEFCRLKRISRAKLYEYWNRGIGPPRVKIGVSVTIRKAAGDAWYASFEETPAAREVA